MNDEVKEILIDLIDYWNAMGTDDDPEIEEFEKIIQRSAAALGRNFNDEAQKEFLRSSDIDPFAMDVVGYGGALKHENDF